MIGHPKCCYIHPVMTDPDREDDEPFHAAGDRCYRDAVYEIHGESHLLHDNTQSCEEHVGELLGSPIDAPRENTSWTVVLTGWSDPKPHESGRSSEPAAQPESASTVGVTN